MYIANYYFWWKSSKFVVFVWFVVLKSTKQTILESIATGAENVGIPSICQKSLSQFWKHFFQSLVRLRRPETRAQSSETYKARSLPQLLRRRSKRFFHFYRYPKAHGIYKPDDKLLDGNIRMECTRPRRSTSVSHRHRLRRPLPWCRYGGGDSGCGDTWGLSCCLQEPVKQIAKLWYVLIMIRRQKWHSDQIFSFFRRCVN